MRCWQWLVPGALVVILACQPAAPLTPTAVPPTPQPAPTASTPSTQATPTTAAPASTGAATPAAPPTTATRVESLNAANAAFRAGDLKTAVALYERVVNTPPASSETAAASAAITDFAYFRGMVGLLAESQEDEAKAQLDALQQRDPNAPLSRLGSQLWDQYGMTGQLRGACAQLQPQIASQAGGVLATLQGLGVAVDGPTLCSVP
jgi:tetratricopeptide (TPR) repeat protein